jgi:intracellular septation protein
MSEQKQNNQMLKTILETLPVAIFFLTYIFFKNEVVEFAGQEYTGFVLATAIFVPFLCLSTVIGWRLFGEVSKVQLLTLVLVLVFGGLTIFLNDERFFKMKPTLVYVLFGGAILVGLLQGKSYLKSILGSSVPMQDEGWMIISRRIMIFFFSLAVLNEIIWRTQSSEVWVYFKTFGLTFALLVFLATQYKVLQQYGEFEEDQE